MKCLNQQTNLTQIRTLQHQNDLVQNSKLGQWQDVTCCQIIGIISKFLRYMLKEEVYPGVA